MHRLLLLIGLTFLLAGCVLQSATPVVSENQGELVLGSAPLTYAAYTLNGEDWQKDTDTATFTPAAHHYVVSDGKSTADVTFKTLPGERFLLQMTDDKGAVSYALAQIEKGEIYASPLWCTELVKLPAMAPLVTTSGNDCNLKADADPALFLAALGDFPLERRLKLAPLN